MAEVLNNTKIESEKVSGPAGMPGGEVTTGRDDLAKALRQLAEKSAELDALFAALWTIALDHCDSSECEDQAIHGLVERGKKLADKIAMEADDTAWNFERRDILLLFQDWEAIMARLANGRFRRRGKRPFQAELRPDRCDGASTTALDFAGKLIAVSDWTDSGSLAAASGDAILRDSARLMEGAGFTKRT